VTKQYLQQQLISLLSIPEGKLTKEELLAFYDDLSVNFPHDEPFLKYVSQQWNYSPNNTPTVSEQYLREIIKALRHKLIQKTNGTNDEFLLKKLFTGFDENKNGYISAFELDLMLKRL
jgi:Ca2+-binding EF-hand superfamily protein